MYQACIFDLDGTLANTLESIAFFANSALEKCGCFSIKPERYRFLVGNGADRLMRGMLDEVKKSYSEQEVARLRGVYDDLYESDPMHLVSGYDGMEELLHALKKRGLRLAVLSNKPDNVTTQVVRQLFGAGLFDCCYGQRPQVPRKPSPQGALLIARELGVEPAACLYIGDTNVDMKTGAAAGMTTVGVLWGFRDRAELEESRAQHIVEKPAQIYELAVGEKML